MSFAPSIEEGGFSMFVYLIGASGDGEVEEEVKKERMVMTTKKGAAVID